jgi:hypothetical protein
MSSGVAFVSHWMYYRQTVEVGVDVTRVCPVSEMPTLRELGAESIDSLHTSKFNIRVTLMAAVLCSPALRRNMKVGESTHECPFSSWDQSPRAENPVSWVSIIDCKSLSDL